jgi:hypothetical protein
VNDAIALAVVGWSVQTTSCTDGIVSFIAREPPNAPYAVTNGGFTFSNTSSTFGTLTVSGSLNGSTGSGTLGVNDTHCVGVFNGTWTATKASGPEVNLTGTWRSTFQSSLVSRTDGTLVLTQSGSAVTGTYSLVNGATGSVSGTVIGRMLTFKLTQTTAGCAGTFTGHGAVMAAPELLTYFYTGSDCLGAHVGGSGSGTRQ